VDTTQPNRQSEQNTGTTRVESTTRRAVLRTVGAATTAGIGLVGASETASSTELLEATCGSNEGGPTSFPRVTTRGHFTVGTDGVTLTEDHTKTDWETAGDFDGIYDGDELLVFVHGWNVTDDEALDIFYTGKQAFRANGFDESFIGFSYGSDREWESAKTVAERNGPKLGRFLADVRERHPDITLQLVAHSLGARVVLSALSHLADGGYENLVASVSLLGGAADDHSVSKGGQYHTAVETATASFENFHKTDDQVLQDIYGLYELGKAVGEVGCDGTSPTNYEDHDVTDSVTSHCGYYKEDVGCIPEVVAEF
jgi:esterase/lipase superfamily enzyme